jgi:hypothetical protein
MDVFIDELLMKDRVYDTILPRIPKRKVLEESGDIVERISGIQEEVEALLQLEMIEKVTLTLFRKKKLSQSQCYCLIYHQCLLL